MAFYASSLSGIDRIQPSGVYGPYGPSGGYPLMAGQRAGAYQAERSVQIERAGSTNQIGGAADNLNGGKNLSEVCRDFEAIFLQYLIREMRASVPKDDLFDGGFQEEVFMSLFDESLAKELAKRGGIGIGDMLVKQLSDSSRIVHPAAKAPVIGKSEGNRREGDE